MTSALVVDTSVLIDHLRGVTAATDLLTTTLASDRLLASSALCRLELIAGVRKGEGTKTAQLIDQIEWWPVDDAVLVEAEDLVRVHSPSNRGIGAVDYCLAATARLLDAELATINVKHFPMFRDLKAPY